MIETHEHGGGIASFLIILEFAGVKTRFQKLNFHKRLNLLWLCIALAFVAVGLYGKFRSRAVTPYNIQYHVRDWLEDFRMENQKWDAPRGRFAYLVAVPRKKLTIVQPNDHQSFLVVGCTMHLAGEEKRIFDSKPEPERRRVWQQLMITLLVSTPHVEVDPIAQAVTITKWLPITNDLTEAKLYDSLEEVLAGVELAENQLGQLMYSDSVSLQWQFKPPPPSSRPLSTPDTGSPQP